MDKVNELVVLKILLHEAINGDEHGVNPDLTKTEMEAIEWAIEQAEKVERYEKVLKEICHLAITQDEIQPYQVLGRINAEMGGENS